MHITKPLLAEGSRTSSESDSGAPPLSRAASNVSFSPDHVAEFQEESQDPEREPCSSVWGDTTPSSPSKSEQDMEDSPCHHQATSKKVAQEKGI